MVPRTPGKTGQSRNGETPASQNRTQPRRTAHTSRTGGIYYVQVPDLGPRTPRALVLRCVDLIIT